MSSSVSVGSLLINYPLEGAASGGMGMFELSVPPDKMKLLEVMTRYGLVHANGQ